jgi:prepilin-type N-terminal cleavage/methylation domain-containing protein
MTKNNKKGFTIIEVVLVLAIAGLIFLMVFIALPALQRSQRNTRRRQDMARILSAFNDFQANNNGRMPEDTTEANSKFKPKYIGEAGSDQVTDPDGTEYSFVWSSKLSGDLTIEEAGTGKAEDTGPESGTAYLGSHHIGYLRNASCGDEGKAKMAKGEREIAIFYILEGGSIYCGDNQ